VYLRVFTLLLVLTAVTTAVAYLDLGFLNAFVAIAIACVKALAVALWFMHLRYSSRLVVLVAGAGIFWLLILFAFSIGDYVTRASVPGWG
jgi:cytochrome c oxidase subunit 4